MMRALPLILLCCCVSACTQSLKEIGREPVVSPVGSGLLDQQFAAREEFSDMARDKSSFSTWNNSKGDLFTDKVAMKRGDILTVLISINDSATFSNQSDSKRTSGRALDFSGSGTLTRVTTTGNADAGINSNSTFKGQGGTTRAESLNLSIAAVVVKVFGNGSLLVRGSQEVRVNSELRIMSISGIVRPEDIGADNTISYERIAEARVAYGGRGHISHVQRPPYGQQLVDHILPF